MGAIKVSVIIPVYNVRAYLGDCLDSLLGQTCPDFEVICVDDGSNDGSLELAREYEQKDSRIRVLCQQHGFAGRARNLGLQNAQGEYVLFLDSDDFFDPDLIRLTSEKADEQNADIVIFGAQKYDTSDRAAIPSPQYFRRNLFQDHEVFCAADLPESIFQVSNPAPWTKLFRREFVQRHGLAFEPWPNSNDLYFDLMAMALAERIAWVDQVLTSYRIGMGGNTQSLKKKDPLCFIKAYRSLYDGLKKAGKWDLLEKSFVQLALSGSAYNLNTIHDDAALVQIWSAMQEPMFTEMGLLSHEPDYYSVPEDYQAVAGTAQALAWRRKILSQGEAKNFHGLSDPASRNPKPLVSVIIPVYNVEKYLGECLQSVMDQTLENLEILCVNDGSKDHSMEILMQYAAKDSRIRVYEQKNAGLSAGRNALLAEAAGKYVLFLDSDDMLRKDTLMDLTQIAEEKELDVVYFDAAGFSEEKIDTEELQEQLDKYSSYYVRKHDYSAVTTGPELMRQFLQNEEYRTSACLQLIRRDLLVKNHILFIDGILHEDQAFNFRNMLHAQRVSHVGQQYYQRRVRLDSIMTVHHSFANVYGYFKAYREMNEVLLKVALENDQLMAAKEIAARAFKNARDIYLSLSSEEQYAWKGILPVDQLDFEFSIVMPADRLKQLNHEKERLQLAYHEKSEVNAKLQKTYAEKSEINAKLQKTYAEKSEINAKLKAAREELSQKKKELSEARHEIQELKHPLKSVAKAVLHKDNKK